jgi:hypothetical protein
MVKSERGESMEHNIVFEHGGKVCIRASALGGCRKALALAMAGYEPQAPPEQLQLVFAAGHAAEVEAKEALIGQGFDLDDDQLQVKLSVGDMDIIGHIDGTVDNGFVKYVLEVKSQSNEMFKRFSEGAVPGAEGDLWWKYAWQASVYQVALGMPLMFLRWNRDTSEMGKLVINDPWFGREDIEARVAEVKALSQAEGLAGTACEATWGCPYAYTHEKDDVEVVRDDLLKNYVHDYLALSEGIKKLGAERDEMKEMITERMKANGWVKVALLGGETVAISTTTTRPHMVKGSTTTRLTVKGTRSD